MINEVLEDLKNRLVNIEYINSESIYISINAIISDINGFHVLISQQANDKTYVSLLLPISLIETIRDLDTNEIIYSKPIELKK